MTDKKSNELKEKVSQLENFIYKDQLLNLDILEKLTSLRIELKKLLGSKKVSI